MDETAPRGWGRPEPEPDARASNAADALWPVEPDPGLTNLAGRQSWRFADGTPLSAEVGGVRIAAGDARIDWLGVHRDAAGRPFPAAFARSPLTGEALHASDPAPDPEILDVDADSLAEVPLPSGVPALARAGLPAALYLFQENLGALEAWDGRGFSAMGRMPPRHLATHPAMTGLGLAAGPHGLAYATADRLVSVGLPQLGPRLSHAAAGAPGLRFLSAPCWRGVELLALGAHDGRLVLCRSAAGSEAIKAADLDRAAPVDGLARFSGHKFSGPWTNRLGDAFWTGAAGFVACRDGVDATFVPWPEGFSPLLGLEPWRDRADLYHQPGTVGDRHHLAALAPEAVPRGLDGPHLPAGGVTYCGAERFDTPGRAPAEGLNLGALTGALLVPLLALARDTVLLALDIPGPRGGFLRGERLPAPVTGHVLHHAHGAGLRRLPAGLAVSGLGDAGALLHAGALYLWSRPERRCCALRLRAA